LHSEAPKKEEPRVIIRYKIDNARLQARLYRDPDASAARAFWLVVTYETDHDVSHSEARRDCEMISATRQELEQLRGAGYDIPLATDFTEAAA
jgi:hypothetical protein